MRDKEMESLFCLMNKQIFAQKFILEGKIFLTKEKT
jgi:hypothetical protein